MLTKPFHEATHIIETIEKHNHQAYFVGGCVRDIVLGRSIEDIDIATSAPPNVICTIFPSVIPVGIDHGTVIVRHEKKSYEVTTFRVDGNYSDQRHPDEVKFITTIDEDLRRRDFTMNALAMNKNGHIIDLFNGQEDIKMKIIRTVGNGEERFTEDPLRIIRALRFVSQLGFSLDPTTVKHMNKVKPEIEKLAVERITNEFQKFFSGSYVKKGMNTLINEKIYNYLPVFKDHPELLQSTLDWRPFFSFGEVIALFHKLDEQIPIPSWVQAWKCSNKIKREAIKLTEALTYFENNGFDNWLAYQLPGEFINGFLNLFGILYPQEHLEKNKIHKAKACLQIQSKHELAINGDELIELFPTLPKGPWINESLQRLEKQVVFNNIKNENIKLKEWILCHPPEIS
ncbi:CCA tRNA nucleotidyltransferase [Virgibacillus sp. W0430]|uniref:CCA tRNA nucleotidyltransferase n=1 Tax=Virgibacillus sp. W0430 TaxID=3391580 RepID=UPI003F47665A